ncbi:DUF2279 domain-containing protein [Mangrovivirga sp. M17]|uniref:DUF2279 domain-containing protein n=1 Tax=Mangrovivirga halotolerans TaxID=2993936 RepID=A0ABT3RVL9_9BACT|nr:DUF2279 domain-containing protein [Mangrovivirga halotolerans]MCX2745817.1 DUF2279 domain-containing protein [Mangrovivirga halotolerans]
MNALVRILLTSLIILSPLRGFSQYSDTETDTSKNRVTRFALISAGTYAATMTYLGTTWYKNDEKVSFRWFDDSQEWKQMDKVGHVAGSFFITELMVDGLRNAGLENKKSVIYGAAAATVAMASIEIFDGYSPDYGASATDLLANLVGTGLFVLQSDKSWEEQWVRPKFSFSTSGYAELRPEVLGNGLHEQILKDYNGQTYWLSIQTDNFGDIPGWLSYINIGIGYGAEDMIYARDNMNIESGFDPYRQFYLAPDIDLSAIRTNKKWLKFVLKLVNYIHLPTPALEINTRGKVIFHPIYF